MGHRHHAIQRRMFVTAYYNVICFLHKLLRGKGVCLYKSICPAAFRSRKGPEVPVPESVITEIKSAHRSRKAFAPEYPEYS